MRMIIIVLIITILPVLIFGQRISFFREDLDFKLTKDIFEVDGLYYFRNLTDGELKQMLFYPFPDVEIYGKIAYIKINIENDTASLLATQSSKGSMFKVMIPPNGEVACRIRYGQKLISNEAMYIITTTQRWARPFEIANYSLTFPDNIKLDSISMPPDSISQPTGETKYYWKKEDFMPDVDFIFRFQSSKLPTAE